MKNCLAPVALLLACASAMPPYEKKEYEMEIPCNVSSGDPTYDDFCNHGTCGMFGVGHTGLVCECSDSYATPSSYNESGVLDVTQICSKSRKKQITAILLTVFLGGFGAGSFYMDWVAWGVIPFVLCCGGCLCISVATAMGKTDDSGEKKPGFFIQCFGMCLQCACTGLLIATLVFVATSDCVDKDGIACQS